MASDYYLFTSGRGPPSVLHLNSKTLEDLTKIATISPVTSNENWTLYKAEIPHRIEGNILSREDYSAAFLLVKDGTIQVFPDGPIMIPISEEEANEARKAKGK